MSDSINMAANQVTAESIRGRHRLLEINRPNLIKPCRALETFLGHVDLKRQRRQGDNRHTGAIHCNRVADPDISAV
jgi:hypothetical protein